jgi:hypothetical protein
LRTTRLVALAFGLLFAATAAAGCASSPGEGGDGDGGVGDAGPTMIDAAVGVDAGTRLWTGWCSGGGWVSRSDGMHGPICFGPADIATKERRLDSDRWLPGPIYRVAP